MRRRPSAALLALLGTLAAPVIAAAPAPSPCTTAAASCLATHPIGDHKLRYYRSLPITEAGAPKAVLIAIHGYQHDADVTFNAVAKAAQTSGALGTTLIVAPVFQPEDDPNHKPCTGTPKPEPGELTWSCGGWSQGHAASGHGPTVFDVTDQFIEAILAANPSIRTVTVAGFSDGGQMVQHYAAVAAPKLSSAKLRFVVGDPGSWLYFDPTRPYPVHDGKPVPWSACQPTSSGSLGCDLAMLPDVPGPPARWTPPAGWTPPQKCDSGWRNNFNNWKYGTNQPPSEVKRSAADMRSAYATADVTALLGIGDDKGGPANMRTVFDMSCPANLEGNYRLQRGLGYRHYAETVLKAPHRFVLVPVCTHDPTCVFTSTEAGPVLFPHGD